MRHDSPAATEQTKITDLPVEILSHIASSLVHNEAINLSRALSPKITRGKVCIYKTRRGTLRELELTTNIMTLDDFFWPLENFFWTLEDFFWGTFRQAIFYPHISLTNWNDQEADKEIQRLIQLANLLGFAERMKNKIEKLNIELISLLKKQSTLSNNLVFLMPEQPELPENANDNDKLKYENDKLKYELERLQYVYTALCLFEMDEDAYNSVKRKPILKQTYEEIAEYGHYVSGFFILPIGLFLLPIAVVSPITAIILIACLLFVATMLCIPALIDSQRSTHKRIRDEDEWYGWQSSEDEKKRYHNRDLSELVEDVRLRKRETGSQARESIHHHLTNARSYNLFSCIRRDSKSQSSYTNAAKRAETQIMSQLNPSRV